MSVGNLSPVIRQQAWNLGVVTPGAKLYTYLSGTTTPQVVYLDAARLTPASNPLVADANGRFAAFWLASVAYRMTLTDSADVGIWGPEDGITNAVTDLGDGATGSSLTLTGDLTVGGDLTLTDDASIGGDITFPNSGSLIQQVAGILFPSTQVPSTNANMLDDYEEGSWTPTILGSGGQTGQVYSEQIGRYVKVGKFVVCGFSVTLSTLGTITSNVRVGGLPFTIDNVAARSFGTFEMAYTGLTTSIIKLTGVPTVNTTVLDLFFTTAAATSSVSTQLAQSDLSATSGFRGQFWFMANN